MKKTMHSQPWYPVASYPAKQLVADTITRASMTIENLIYLVNLDDWLCLGFIVAGFLGIDRGLADPYQSINVHRLIVTFHLNSNVID